MEVLEVPAESRVEPPAAPPESGTPTPPLVHDDHLGWKPDVFAQTGWTRVWVGRWSKWV